MEDPATVVVRAARVEDAAAVARVQTLGWQRAYVGLVPATVLNGLSTEAAETRWRTMLSRPRPGTETLLATVGGEVCGMAVVGPSRDEDAPADRTCGELAAIYVLAEHWGRGVGHALHRRGMELLVGLGCTRATLWVLAGNERAMRFYRRQGWRPEGTTKTDDRAGVSLVEERWAVGLPVG